MLIIIYKCKYEEIQSRFNLDIEFVVELDGTKIKNLDNFYYEISKLMQMDTITNLDWFIDSMTDFTWIDNFEKLSSINLIIRNEELFMINDSSKKFEIYDIFENIVIPFWNEDVRKVVCNGKKRNFNIWLVCN